MTADLTFTPPTFHRQAACNTPEVDPDWFFPPDGRHDIAAKAKKVCATCPVQEQCLEYALETQTQGIWAGLVPRKLSRMRTQLGIPTPYYFD